MIQIDKHVHKTVLSNHKILIFPFVSFNKIRRDISKYSIKERKEFHILYDFKSSCVYDKHYIVHSDGILYYEGDSA
jgi:hypothetical protein